MRNQMTQGRVRQWWKGALAFVLLALPLYYISTYRVTKNFHEVEPGRFYRSAQLDGKEMAEIVEDYKIQTVISLRGRPENFSWMDEQEKVLKDKGVKFIHFWWTSNYLPNVDEFRGFIDALRKEKYPILIHCRSGADRTGEASAIYAMDFMGESKQEALEKHLSWSFWHIDWLRPAKKALVRAYNGYDWAMKDYNPCTIENGKYAEPGACKVTSAEK